MDRLTATSPSRGSRDVLTLRLYPDGVCSPRFSMTLAALLIVPAQAATLTPTTRLSVPAAPQVAGLAALAGKERLLCSGSRWLMLDDSGKVTRAAALPDTCLGLSVSPGMKSFLTVTSREVSVWNAADGTNLRRIHLTDMVGAGFQDEQTVLIGTAQGIKRVNLGSGTGELARPGAVNALFTSPDGTKAVVSDGQKVQMLSLPGLEVSSAYRCETPCTAQNVNFSANGRTAAVFAGRTLIGLRHTMPATVILRNADVASGLPQSDNTVLTFTGGNAESRDFQTGRREKTLVTGGLWPGLAALRGNQLWLLSDQGELLTTGPDLNILTRTPLPGPVEGGGLDASGQIYTLNKGNLTLGAKKLPGTYWAVQTMNKTTWALKTDADGGLQVGILGGEKFTPMPGTPRTATHLSVNFWGNHAAVWDDETLWVISQAKNKVVATVKLGGKVQNITLSPDATRAFVFPGEAKNGDAHIVTLATGKQDALPFQPPSTGDWWESVQISGNGTYAYSTRESLSVAFRQPIVNMPAGLNQDALTRFSPDNKWLAYTSRTLQGNVLNLMNTETGKTEASTPPLAALPTFLAWSADSQKLAVGASLLNELASVTVFEVR